MAQALPQKPTPWTPSPKQAAVLEAACDPDVEPSISAIYVAAGVDRSCHYAWKREDPGFWAAWCELFRRQLDDTFPLITKAVVRQALAGDMQAARLAAKMRGALIDRVELSGAVDLDPGTALVEKLSKLREAAKARREAAAAAGPAEDDHQPAQGSDVATAVAAELERQEEEEEAGP